MLLQTPKQYSILHAKKIYVLDAYVRPLFSRFDNEKFFKVLDIGVRQNGPLG